MLITLRGSGIAVSTEDFVACAQIAGLYLSAGTPMSQSTEAESRQLAEVREQGG
jgi:hypothetical protein